MKLHTRFIEEESGQALVESAVFICIMFVLTIFALNFNYYIGFINTIHASSAQSVAFSTQGDLTPFGTLPSADAVVAVANGETGNSTKGSASSQFPSTVNVCSPAGFATANCSGFTDPEATTANTGNFVTNSVQVTQTFKPFFGVGNSVLGINLMPFTTPSTVSHKVFMRALN